jgi:uncharacterized membrane protein YhaH (DUF805 family)
MLSAVKHGLGNLTHFGGRDARQVFWYYVLFLYLITIAIGMAISIPMSVEAMVSGVQQGIANAENPDSAAGEAAVQAAIASSMRGYMPIVVWTGFATAAILLVGLAASLVRRLHDAGISGYWALLPLGLQAINLALIPAQLGKLDEMLAAQLTDPMASLKVYDGVVGLGALAGWSAIIVVIVLGTRKSTTGPNRYGEAPFIA